MDAITVPATPYGFAFVPSKTALVVIDMQRDFLEDAGFGQAQSTNLAAVQATIPPVKALLDLARSLGLAIIHTREGHEPDLASCPSSKLLRNKQTRPADSLSIGDRGPMGRLLIRGEYGHDLVDELQPLPNELVIDKPGKGAFYGTTLMDELRARAITHLIVCGVTTECCFTSTIREANDRGYECCGIREATAGYVESYKEPSLRMIDFAGGLFGFTASLKDLQAAIPPKPYTNGFHAEWNGDVEIPSLTKFYQSGGSVVSVISGLYKRIEDYKLIDPAVWISLEPLAKVLEAAKELEKQYPDPARRPALFGVPFSVKDSLDVAGIETTTACPPLAYIADASSAVYRKTIEGGAIYIGKVNLDQFATGLSGCRSPFGTLHSVFAKEYSSGGSSSGSAVSVAAKLCSFSLATDTAGSGRVPSGLNGVVGYKPTRGTISTVGLVPACPSLDCIALIAQSVADVRLIYNVVKGYDPEDPYAKWAVSRTRPIHATGAQATSFKIGIPPPAALDVCCPVYKRMFRKACEVFASIGGSKAVEVNWKPFKQAGDLLYEGTFVSERLATLPDGWVETNKTNLHPVVYELLSNVEARQSTAVQAYRDVIAKARLTREAEAVFLPGGVDVVLVPTTPIHWSIEEMKADPIKRNAFNGTFTHFGNILDLCAVTVPAGTYATSELGERNAAGDNARLPFSVTLLGLSGTDGEVLEIARRFAAELAARS